MLAVLGPPEVGAGPSCRAIVIQDRVAAPSQRPRLLERLQHAALDARGQPISIPEPHRRAQEYGTRRRSVQRSSNR